MKAKWVSILKEGRGSIGEKQYARRIPGNDVEAAICMKPELSKKTKKKKAEHPTAQRFAELMTEVKAILRDPVRKAEWQARYDEAVQKARKHHSRIQGRLYDYVKHEKSKELKGET